MIRSPRDRLSPTQWACVWCCLSGVTVSPPVSLYSDFGVRVSGLGMTPEGELYGSWSQMLQIIPSTHRQIRRIAAYSRQHTRWNLWRATWVEYKLPLTWPTCGTSHLEVFRSQGSDRFLVTYSGSQDMDAYRAPWPGRRRKVIKLAVTECGVVSVN